jgi:hypothetical protein
MNVMSWCVMIVMLMSCGRSTRPDGDSHPILRTAAPAAPAQRTEPATGSAGGVRVDQLIQDWRGYFEDLRILALTFTGDCDAYAAALQKLVARADALTDRAFALASDRAASDALAAGMDEVYRAAPAQLDARLAERGATRAALDGKDAFIQRTCGSHAGYLGVSESLVRLEGDPALR